MKHILKEAILGRFDFDEYWTSWRYSENVNPDALTEDWLKSRTSYIYKVGVLAAIDANKCDWACIAIGTQREENSPVQVIGVLRFNEGENDDMGRVIKRATQLLSGIHPAFEEAV